MIPHGNNLQPRDQLTSANCAARISLQGGRKKSMNRGGRSLAERLLAAFRSSAPPAASSGFQSQLSGSLLRQQRATSSAAQHGLVAGPGDSQQQLNQQAGRRGRPPKAVEGDREARQASTVPQGPLCAVGIARERWQRKSQHEAAQGQRDTSARSKLSPSHSPYMAQNGHQSNSAPSVSLAPTSASPRLPSSDAQQAPPLTTSDQQRLWREVPQGPNGVPRPPVSPAPALTLPAAASLPAATAALTSPIPQPPPPPPAAAAAADASLGLVDTEDLPQEAIQQVYPNEPPPDVHVVASAADAHAVAARLAAFTPEQLGAMVFGCDTEVMDIDVSAQSPCCHGRVICFSIYCGPDHHFGPEPRPAVNRSMLWVDTYLDGDEERQGEVREIFEAFRPFFESAAHRKVWHNYSFDRHVLERAGFAMRGFGGDTMHMARLWDSSRMTRGGYSLEALSGNAEIMGGAAEGEEAVRGKISMKKLFGRKNLKKDGTEGKLVVLPAMEELQRGADTKWVWVNYSAYDAKSTWDLHRALEAKLRSMDVRGHVDPAVVADYASANGLTGEPVELRTMWDVYCRFYLPFGQLLTDMEAAGLAVDRAHLAEAQERAERDQEEAKERFHSWATAAVPDAEFMNVSSGPQVSQLLFAGCANKIADKAGVPLERVFKVPNTTGYIGEGAKKAKKSRDITLHSVWGRGVRSPLAPEVFTPGGAPACNTVVIKQLAGKAGKARKALAELEAKPDSGFERDDAFLRRSEAGSDALFEGEELVVDEDGSEWSTDNTAITEKQMALQQAALPRDPAELAKEAVEKGYGKLYAHFGTAEKGLRACAAVDALVDVSAIDTLLSNFIVPLQSDAISKPDAAGVPRVHCSLNINTETGRLSARRPNLQNQPALEKDRYKVRKAFTADVAAGKTLVVADYGQLELRILAHMANCRSMIEAFELGGDFHSRTALGMYDHIKAAIASGSCLLEWKGGETGDEPPPAPLLKDLFAAERRKAKVLNFSIAYGKTAHGLSKDWGVSLEEAQDTVDRWYSDRPEVNRWQGERRAEAVKKGYVCTLLGRRRQLPDARSGGKARAHALRAAINTPIQGSAADVAMAAMIRINSDPKLAALGYKLLLQVHDEVILEGPREHAEAARRRVIECMRSPFNASTNKPLLVDLVVDCKFADTWYDAK